MCKLCIMKQGTVIDYMYILNCELSISITTTLSLMAQLVSLFHKDDWNEKWSLEDFSLPNRLRQLCLSSDSPPGAKNWKSFWGALKETQQKAHSFI